MFHLSFSKYNVRMVHLKHGGLDWMVGMFTANLSVSYSTNSSLTLAKDIHVLQAFALFYTSQCNGKQ